jgi:hypothetical protein
MTQQHPITPPPELVQQWALMIEQHTDTEVFTIAAQWGADQELEACCELLNDFNTYHLVELLRAARRPKQPSLKEQALALAEQHEDGWRPSPKDWDTIRRALEQLPDNQ